MLKNFSHDSSITSDTVTVQNLLGNTIDTLTAYITFLNETVIPHIAKTIEQQLSLLNLLIEMIAALEKSAVSITSLLDRVSTLENQAKNIALFHFLTPTPRRGASAARL